MILMAIDHVRVYSGLPAGGPTPGIFFTRWVTHFVAPAFVFLAGTASDLHGRKLGDTSRPSSDPRKTRKTRKPQKTQKTQKTQKPETRNQKPETRTL